MILFPEYGVEEQQRMNQQKTSSVIHEKEKGKLLSVEGGGSDRRSWEESKENIKIQGIGEMGNQGLFI